MRNLMKKQAIKGLFAVILAGSGLLAVGGQTALPVQSKPAGLPVVETHSRPAVHRHVDPTPTPVPVATVAPARPVAVAPIRPVVPAPVRPAGPSCLTVYSSGIAHLDWDGAGVPSYGLWQDSRASGPYLVGHHPGSGSFILGLRVGGCLRYNGRTYRITRAQAVSRVSGGSFLFTGLFTLQTCVTADMAWVQVVQAVPA